ncbi:MAG TPA: thiamine ABC transporter substrate-binding protein, partial [Candidatus Polarisedimenticolia bacterium]|nr:thiamine ABC transporter substrate-binding protein [Candidatus Polarisedimenticolia bacterium]
MKRLLTFILFSVIAIAGASSAARADQPVLTVYVYSSFIADWGPGPAVKKAFEAVCACKINFVGVEDGVVLLSRLRLEGASSPA